MVGAALDTVERQAEGTDFHTGQGLATPCKKVFFIVFFQLLEMDILFVLFQYFKAWIMDAAPLKVLSGV